MKKILLLIMTILVLFVLIWIFSLNKEYTIKKGWANLQSILPNPLSQSTKTIQISEKLIIIHFNDSEILIFIDDNLKILDDKNLTLQEESSNMNDVCRILLNTDEYQEMGNCKELHKTITNIEKNLIQKNSNISNNVLNSL